MTEQRVQSQVYLSYAESRWNSNEIQTMRQAEIYRKEKLAGILTEDGGEYRFCYNETYLAREDAQPISLTLPLQTEAFVSPVLFPFFDGLIPEGWLLDVALRNTDISILDRMSLLLLCCKECIGSVSVVPKNKEGGDHV